MFIYNISYKYQTQILKVCMQPYKIAYTANGISHFGGAQLPCALPFPHCRDLRVYVMMRPRFKCSRKARMTRPASRKMARTIFIKGVLSTITGSNLPRPTDTTHSL